MGPLDRRVSLGRPPAPLARRAQPVLLALLDLPGTRVPPAMPPTLVQLAPLAPPATLARRVWLVRLVRQERRAKLVLRVL